MAKYNVEISYLTQEQRPETDISPYADISRGRSPF